MNKSIAGFEIFHRDDYIRILQTLNYYKKNKPPCMLSTFNKLSTKEQLLIQKKLNETNNIVEIISYCVMPTHLHLVLKQLIDGGISEFFKRLLGGYTNYFNLIHKRNGALFQGRFKSKLINDDAYFLKIRPYTHLNYLVHDIPKEKAHLVLSSEKEYDTNNFTFISGKEAKDVLDFYGGNENFKKECLNTISFIRDERGLTSLLEDDPLP